MATINNVTADLQDIIKQIMTSFETLERMSKDAYDAYWDTDCNTEITGASAGSQVLVTPQVKKEDYANAIVLAENVTKFFNNTAVSTTDHLAYSNAFKYGTDYPTPITEELAPSVSAIGANLYSIVKDCISLLESTRIARNIYNDNEIGDIVAVLDGERVIFGSSMTRNDLSNAIVLFQQWENFMTAQTITTGDYSVTVSKWRVY